MAGGEWTMEGKYVEYCSCDHGCPCVSMAPPTQGHCEGVVAFHIDRGSCDGVDLSGLTIAATFFFPRAIHHGGGHMQPILPSTSTDEQRDAIFYIMSGENQPVGTMFQIFSVIVEHIHEPQFTDITFDWNIKDRTAKVEVPNIVSVRSEPIRNPVTDEPHRIITVLPDGWVFHEAESASGFMKGVGDLKFDLSQIHSSLAHFSWNQNGLVHNLEESRKQFALA